MIQALTILALALFLELAACAAKQPVVDQPTAGSEVRPPAHAAPKPPVRADEGSDSASTFFLPSAGTDMVGELRVAIARNEDTLSHLARQYDLGYTEIIKANPGVDPRHPGSGRRVVLPTQFILPDAPRTGLVLNISARRLFYYPPRRPGERAVVITHPIWVGRESADIPAGEARVIEKIVANPLDRDRTRLGRGCIPLYPEDIEHLFGQIPVGTPVRIVDQPTLTGRRSGTLYMEAHELENRGNDKKNDLNARLDKLQGRVGKHRADIDWNKARGVAKEARGIPIPISAGSPRLADLLAATPEASPGLRASFNFRKDLSSTPPAKRCPTMKFAYAGRSFASMLCGCAAPRPQPLAKHPDRPAAESVVAKVRSARLARDPASVAQEITQALEQSRLTGVQVNVDADLSVTVTGLVDERAKKEAALRIVRQTPGVKSVKDFLSVVRVH